jgi:hypothetical protein
MAHKWHYSQDGAQYGPVDESEIVRLIQDGHLDPGSPVCMEGAMAWQPARNHVCFQVEIYPRKTKSSAPPAGTTPKVSVPAPISKGGSSNFGGTSKPTGQKAASAPVTVSSNTPGPNQSLASTNRSSGCGFWGFGVIVIAVLVVFFWEDAEKVFDSITDTVDDAAGGVLPGLSASEKESIRARVLSVNSNLNLNESSATTVQQQIVSRQTAALEMAGLFARTLGASEESVSSILSSMRLDDISNETVFQQNALRSRYLVKMLGLAAENTGASTSSISSIESRMALREIEADTVYQQIAIRQSAVVEMAGLLAEALGASSSVVASEKNSMSISDINAETVQQQIALRMRYVIQMLVLAADAVGVNASLVKSEINLREINAETVFQQMAIRVDGAKEVLEMMVRKKVN